MTITSLCHPRDHCKQAQKCVQDTIGTNHKQPCRCNRCVWARWISYELCFMGGYSWSDIAEWLRVKYSSVRFGCLRAEELAKIDQQFRKVYLSAICAATGLFGKDGNAGIH